MEAEGMSVAMRYLVAVLAASALPILSGCGTKDSGSGPLTASIAGSSAAKTSAATPKGPPPRDKIHPKVLIQTTAGDILVKLDAKRAPQTVDNFLTYVDSGFYDQTVFHQAVKDRLLLGGTYDAKIKEKKSGIPIRCEADNGLKNTRGTIGMARCPDAVDSATSQFYFNLSENTWLDHKARTLKDFGFCVFGEVVSGMDVIEKIAAAPVEKRPAMENLPVNPVVITKARVVP
jgi:cyclophilin family peptidyl-prolyl cis-trans isomerase